MGTEASAAIVGDQTLELAGLVDRLLSERLDRQPPESGSLDSLLATVDADTMLELTHAESAVAHAQLAMENGVAPVIGASGLMPDDISRLSEVSTQTGTPGMWVPNFSIGAVLMMKFATMAAKYFPHAEIVEIHHDQKVDAPSGTALRTAELVAGARPTVPIDPTKQLTYDGARGANVGSVPVHSIRLPGYLAHQEVLFGSHGETLTIRHDSSSRACFMEGIKLCLGRIRHHSGFLVGMDQILEI
jgi:4-hydroxy-tetrahydrodipicolinate reductase